MNGKFDESVTKSNRSKHRRDSACSTNTDVSCFNENSDSTSRRRLVRRINSRRNPVQNNQSDAQDSITTREEIGEITHLLQQTDDVEKLTRGITKARSYLKGDDATIKLIINSLFANHDEKLQQEGFLTLWHASANNPKYKEIISNNNGLTLIANTVITCVPVDTFKLACGALASLVLDSKIASSCLELGIVRDCHRTLADIQRSQKSYQWCYRFFLTMLYASDQFKKDLFEEFGDFNVVYFTLNAIMTKINDAASLEWLLIFLSTLFTCDGVEGFLDQFETNEGSKIILSTLKKFPYSYSIQQQGLLIIMLVIDTATERTTEIVLDNIEYVICAMRTFHQPCHIHLHLHGGLVLRQLIEKDKNSVDVISKGVDIFVSMLQMDHHQDIQKIFLSILIFCSVLSEKVINEIIISGGIDACQFCFCSSLDDTVTFQMAVGLFFNLHAQKDKLPLLTTEHTNYLLTSMRASKSSMEYQSIGCCVLACLAIDGIIAEDSTSYLYNLMNQNPKNPIVLAQVFRAMGNIYLCDDQAGSNPIISVNLIFDIMDDFNDDAYLNQATFFLITVILTRKQIQTVTMSLSVFARIPGIVDILKKHSSSLGLYKRACELMNVVIPKCSKELDSYELLNVIGRSLYDFRYDNDYMETACIALCSFSFHLKRNIDVTSTVENILDVLLNRGGSDNIVACCCNILWNMLLKNCIDEQTTFNSIFHAILLTIKNKGTKVKIGQVAVGVLSAVTCYSVSCDLSPSIVTESIMVCVECVYDPKDGANADLFLEYTMLAITNLIKRDSFRETFKEVFPVILSFTIDSKAHGVHEKTCLLLASFLECVCADLSSQNRTLFSLDEFMLRSLFDTYKLFPTSKGITRAILSILMSICTSQPDLFEEIADRFDMTQFSLVSSSMGNFPFSRSIQYTCCELLYSICSDLGVHHLLVYGDLVDSVLTTMKRYSDFKGIIEKGLGALSELLLKVEEAWKSIDSDGSDVFIVMLMRDFMGKELVQERALKILFVICKNSVEAQSRILHSNGLNSIIFGMMANIESCAVQEYGLKTLSVLCQHDKFFGQAAEYDFGNFIRCVMDAHYKSNLVQELGMELNNLFLDSYSD